MLVGVTLKGGGGGGNQGGGGASGGAWGGGAGYTIEESLAELGRLAETAGLKVGAGGCRGRQEAARRGRPGGRRRSGAGAGASAQARLRLAPPARPHPRSHSIPP
jgi:hypothetical protein